MLQKSAQLHWLSLRWLNLETHSPASVHWVSRYALLHELAIASDVDNCFDGSRITQRAKFLPIKIDYESLPFFLVADTDAHRRNPTGVNINRIGALKIDSISEVEALSDRRGHARQPVGDDIIVGLLRAGNLD